MVAVSTNLTVMNLIGDVKEKVAVMVDDMIDTDVHQQSTGAFIAVSRYSSATHIPPSVLSRGVGWQIRPVEEYIGDIKTSGAKQNSSAKSKILFGKNTVDYRVLCSTQSYAKHQIDKILELWAGFFYG